MGKGRTAISPSIQLPIYTGLCGSLIKLVQVTHVARLRLEGQTRQVKPLVTYLYISLSEGLLIYTLTCSLVTGLITSSHQRSHSWSVLVPCLMMFLSLVLKLMPPDHGFLINTLVFQSWWSSYVLSRFTLSFSSPQLVICYWQINFYLCLYFISLSFLSLISSFVSSSYSIMIYLNVSLCLWLCGCYCYSHMLRVFISSSIFNPRGQWTSVQESKMNCNTNITVSVSEFSPSKRLYVIIHCFPSSQTRTMYMK